MVLQSADAPQISHGEAIFLFCKTVEEGSVVSRLVCEPKDPIRRLVTLRVGALVADERRANAYKHITGIVSQPD